MLFYFYKVISPREPQSSSTDKKKEKKKSYFFLLQNPTCRLSKASNTICNNIPLTGVPHCWGSQCDHQQSPVPHFDTMRFRRFTTLLKPAFSQQGISSSPCPNPSHFLTRPPAGWAPCTLWFIHFTTLVHVSKFLQNASVPTIQKTQQEMYPLPPGIGTTFIFQLCTL